MKDKMDLKPYCILVSGYVEGFSYRIIHLIYKSEFQVRFFLLNF